ncbi:ergosterol biosynthesis protein [Coemansia nantahalensis]|uniref:Ergosterol biosynthesis protein n=2 Tax=Coemansia TaxID=4863 RepID=A0ACC1L9J7_9FUNG|nr:ergosterol biosynthesis protein [Coemansia nantahalensis]KAJ2803766.1 ergosterol biosynthesis protein [Coemansia helicoidea]
MLGGLLVLPEGGLPKLILLSAAFSVFNTVQCMLAPLGMTRRIYSQQPQQVTPLTSHVFAAWTALSAVLRYQCAFNMGNAALYDLAFWSYAIAAVHFASEVAVFRTSRIPGPVVSTFCVALTTMAWMARDRDIYVR